MHALCATRRNRPHPLSGVAVCVWRRACASAPLERPSRMQPNRTDARSACVADWWMWDVGGFYVLFGVHWEYLLLCACVCKRVGMKLRLARSRAVSYSISCGLDKCVLYLNFKLNLMSTSFEILSSSSTTKWTNISPLTPVESTVKTHPTMLIIKNTHTRTLTVLLFVWKIIDLISAHSCDGLCEHNIRLANNDDMDDSACTASRSTGETHTKRA